MGVAAWFLSGGGVTFIDGLRGWPLLACVNGPPSVALESGGLRGGPGPPGDAPGSPSGVENEPPGSSNPGLRRPRLGVLEPKRGVYRCKMTPGEAESGRSPTNSKNQAKSGRSPTESGDEATK